MASLTRPREWYNATISMVSEELKIANKIEEENRIKGLIEEERIAREVLVKKIEENGKTPEQKQLEKTVKEVLKNMRAGTPTKPVTGGTSKERRKIDRAQKGHIKVKSKGVDDIRIISDDGTIIDLPIVSATWSITAGELPTLKLELKGQIEIELDGCEIQAKKGKKTVPINDFIEKKGEDNNET